MKTKRFLSLLLCALLLLPVPRALAEQGEKEAEVREIRHITTVEHLKKLAKDCRLDSNSQGLVVYLDADLDLSGEAFYPIPSFGGVFEGGGHRITGLSLATDGSHQGLFRYIQPEGMVRDLQLTGTVEPENGRCQLGGLAGVNRGTVENCSFEGSVSGLNAVGGLVGENYGSLRGCSVSGSVDGKRSTGGIAGYNEGRIENCENRAAVNVSITETGLQLEDLTVLGLGAAELTNAEDEDVVSDSGGVVGYSTGAVLNCRNYAAVGYPHYGYNVGGIAGRQSGCLSGCENRGEICGRKDIGGIVGQMEPFLELKESVNLAEELALLNEKMNAVSATMGEMSDEMRTAMDGLDRSSSSAAGKIDGDSGTIAPAGRDGESEADGSIAPADGGSIDGEGVLTDEDLQNGLDAADDAGLIDSDNITVPDGLSDDLNDMADNMALLYGVIADNAGEFSEEMTDMNNQLSRVMLLMANALNGAANRKIFEDVSDGLEEDQVEGRVCRCLNLGSVDGDRNVGGVIGDMGIEYEFDLEGNLTEAIGIEGIVSNTYEAKCVSSDNVNRGSVSGKKEAVGGVVGLEEMGSVLRCEGYGSVSCDGSYVGGVAGLSRSVIRRSYAMCDLSGTEYVGGIAGSAVTLSDCVSMVGMGDVTACSGAVAGWAEPDGEKLSGNHFVHETLGAIDGISYSGMAEPLSYEELLRQEGLPEPFRTLRLSFVADGELVKQIEFSYGGGIRMDQIPPVPEKEGYTGDWPSYDYSRLYYSAVIEAVYMPRQGALASKLTRDDSPMAIVILEGDFEKSTQVNLREFREDDPPELEGTVREKWVMQLSRAEDDQHYSLRYLPPAVERNSRIVLYVREDGAWRRVDTEKTGSYLSFDCSGSRVVFCAVEEKTDLRKPIIIAVAAGAVLLGAGVAIGMRKKKKKSAAAQETAPEGEG